ncbi:MAG: hypothetical protein GX593_14690, partial [Actinomycetales bacterium]|nr:hypothetical protein [Actinomycetales bacterium]
MTTTAFRLGAACAVATLAMTLGACATPRDGHPAGEPIAAPGAPIAATRAHPDLPFPACEGLALPRGDASLYKDEPRYGNASELSEAVLAWAEQHTGFEQLWLDREHHGWVHAGFSGDVDIEALQVEVAQKFPGEGVVVVGL